MDAGPRREGRQSPFRRHLAEARPGGRLRQDLGKAAALRAERTGNRRLQKKDFRPSWKRSAKGLPAGTEIELWWQCMVRLRFARRNTDPRQTLLQRIRLVRGQCLPQPQWEPLGYVPYKTTRFSDLLPPPGLAHPAARILSTGTIRLRTRSDPRRHRFLPASHSAVRLRRRSAERARFWTAPPRRSVPPCWRLRPRSCWCACRARPNGP